MSRIIIKSNPIVIRCNPQETRVLHNTSDRRDIYSRSFLINNLFVTFYPCFIKAIHGTNPYFVWRLLTTNCMYHVIGENRLPHYLFLCGVKYTYLTIQAAYPIIAGMVRWHTFDVFARHTFLKRSLVLVEAKCSVTISANPYITKTILSKWSRPGITTKNSFHSPFRSKPFQRRTIQTVETRYPKLVIRRNEQLSPRMVCQLEKSRCFLIIKVC